MVKKIMISMLLLLFIIGNAFAGAIPQMELGSGSGNTGETVTLPVTLTNVPGSNISAIAMDISYDVDVLGNPIVTIGPAGNAAGKKVVMSTPSPGLFRIGVIGINNTTISDGVVANVSFTVKSTAKPGNTELTVNLSASDPDGKSVSLIDINDKNDEKGRGTHKGGGAKVKIMK